MPVGIVCEQANDLGTSIDLTIVIRNVSFKIQLGRLYRQQLVYDLLQLELEDTCH